MDWPQAAAKDADRAPRAPWQPPGRARPPPGEIQGSEIQGSGLVFCHLLPLPRCSFHPPTAATSLTIFIAHHSRHTTKQFSQPIRRYREGGFTRLHGLPALILEARWMLLRYSINTVTLSRALASSKDAGNQPAGAGNATLGSAYSGLRANDPPCHARCAKQ